MSGYCKYRWMGIVYTDEWVLRRCSVEFSVVCLFYAKLKVVQLIPVLHMVGMIVFAAILFCKIAE